MSGLAGAADLAERVLHGLRVKGMADVDGLTQAAGGSSDQITAVLEALEERGWVRYRDGKRSKGWMLQAQGRAEAERLAVAEMESSGQRGAVLDLYGAFKLLDPELKRVCTDFQIRGDQVMNDHTDPDYDAEVIARLAAVNQRVQPILTGLADALDRFGHYAPRLDFALSRVAAGDLDWFTKPSLDSYHEVWFELHEDLLVTLGLDRAAETAADSADA
ncbi:MAG: MarR family transcriptional regulator [bacterium]|nr:MarR family transcriptional regulator [bacterium]MCY4271983.1 MarR family transcriptional regulator [bacterium]